MRKTMPGIYFLILALVIAGGVVGVATADLAPDEPVGNLNPIGANQIFSAPNLIQNPSFEGNYSAYEPDPAIPDCPAGICQTAQMAEHWTPWWSKPRSTDVNPEYKPATSNFVNPDRVRSGDRAQQYFSFSSTHVAGFYQQVGVLPGGEYRFSIWGHSWSAHDDDDAYSGPQDGFLDQKVGIDPTGGTDWQSANVIWGPPRRQYDIFGQFEINAVAQSPTMTVFTYSSPLWPVKHNDVYWDDAQLELITKMEVFPSNGLLFLADINNQGKQDSDIAITFSNDGDFSWQTAVDAGGTLTPLLNPTSGMSGGNLNVEVDSTGKGLGIYSTTITITSPLISYGSPTSLPVTLMVVQDLHNFFAPVVFKE